MDCRLQAFGGLRGSPFTSLWWQMNSFTSLWWLAWIAVCKPLVADGVFNKPLVAYVDRLSQAFGDRWSHLQAFGGIRGSSFTSLWWQMESFPSLWWHMWVVVYKTFGGVRGSSWRSLWWHTWIADCKPLVAYVDRRSQAFGGIRGSSVTSLWWQMESFTSLWWLTGIVVYVVYSAVRFHRH